MNPSNCTSPPTLNRVPGAVVAIPTLLFNPSIVKIGVPVESVLMANALTAKGIVAVAVLWKEMVVVAADEDPMVMMLESR